MMNTSQYVEYIQVTYFLEGKNVTDNYEINNNSKWKELSLS